MAQKVTIGGEDDLFIGTDQTIRFEIFSIASGVVDSSAAKQAMQTYRDTGTAPSNFDTLWTPVDMSGWTVLFDVRTSDTASSALASKTASITGSYNATRTSNTQRAVVTLTDDDLASTIFSEKTYRYSLKRTDAGSETVLNYGDFKPERVTQV